jgi:hypothetical protein
MICVRFANDCYAGGHFKLIHEIQIDPEFILSGRRSEILPQPIRDKVWACLATRFNVLKNVVRTVIKLDQEIIQFGKVRRFQGGDLMTGRHFVKKSEDTRDASFVRVSIVINLRLQFLSLFSSTLCM